jgi:hypothetical protein
MTSYTTPQFCSTEYVLGYKGWRYFMPFTHIHTYLYNNMPWHRINAFYSVKPVSKSKGKIKHVHSSFAFHMTVVVILCISQSTFFYSVVGPKFACFPFLLFLVVGKISVYIFSFFVCCLALVVTEYVAEWRIFVNDSSSPFFLYTINSYSNSSRYTR